jgi:hypothetical protein
MKSSSESLNPRPIGLLRHRDCVTFRDFRRPRIFWDGSSHIRSRFGEYGLSHLLRENVASVSHAGTSKCCAGGSLRPILSS